MTSGDPGIPASVPPGWQLVPVEPTPEMLGSTLWPSWAAIDYQRMLAAAPQPPVVEQSDGDTVPVPRSLLGAACAAINLKRAAPKVLEQLRRYTFGDLSKPPVVEQEPVAWSVMQNGEICWDADYPFSNEPGWSDSDQECVPLYTHPQPPVVEQSATVSASAYDRLQTLCDSQAARIIELEQPRQPLTTEMADLGWELHGSSDAYQAWHLAVEWTERTHGIGGKE